MALRPKISVIMPVYNGERYLRESIQSILRQTLRQFEFIIVNDSSTDSSASIINSFDDPRIRSLDRPHGGMDEQLNYGISVASAPLIAFAEQDDIALPNRFQVLLDFLTRNPEVGIVSSSFCKIDSSGRFLGEQRFPITDEDIRRLFPVFCPIAFCSSLCRREIVLKAGGFRSDAFPSNDFDLWLRMLPLTRFGNVADILVHKRFHDEAATRRLQQTGASKRLLIGLKYIKDQEAKLLDDEPERFRLKLAEAKLHYYYGSMSIARKFLLKLLSRYPLNAVVWRFFVASLLGDRVFRWIRRMGIASKVTSFFRRGDLKGEYLHP